MEPLINMIYQFKLFVDIEHMTDSMDFDYLLSIRICTHLKNIPLHVMTRVEGMPENSNGLSQF